MVSFSLFSEVKLSGKCPILALEIVVEQKLFQDFLVTTVNLTLAAQAWLEPQRWGLETWRCELGMTTGCVNIAEHCTSNFRNLVECGLCVEFGGSSLIMQIFLTAFGTHCCDWDVRFNSYSKIVRVHGAAVDNWQIFLGFWLSSFFQPLKVHSGWWEWQ